MTGIDGVGVGLRTPHIQTILEEQPRIPWFELLTDNWLDASGTDGVLLDAVLERYPVALHGVSMNIGGTLDLDMEYLAAVKRLAERCRTETISDHLCFSAVAGHALHDLAPLPYTEEALNHVCQRVMQIQDYFGHQLVIENISAYLKYQHETLSEVDFFNTLARQTGCGILLDLNNLYVNQINLNRSSEAYLENIQPEHVVEIHLGGHASHEDHLIDAHNNPVCDAVWGLYKRSLEVLGTRPTLIEWDNQLPSFDVLLNEKRRADHVQHGFYKPSLIQRVSHA